MSFSFRNLYFEFRGTTRTRLRVYYSNIINYYSYYSFRNRFQNFQFVLDCVSFNVIISIRNVSRGIQGQRVLISLIHITFEIETSSSVRRSISIAACVTHTHTVSHTTFILQRQPVKISSPSLPSGCYVFIIARM